MQHATGKMHLTTHSVQHTTSRQHRHALQRVICSEQQTTCTAQQATCARLPATCSGKRRHATQHAACSMQRATCSMQQATWNLETTIDNRQHGNKATCDMQQPPRRRRQNHATHATDNVQQTADDMQEHASSCEMQRETHGTAAFRVRRAACSGQAAACEKHCTRQPVRNTAQTPHTRCNIRPVPQQAASTRGTDTTQQALKRTR